MTTILFTIGLVALAMLLLSIGIILANKPPRGGCGSHSADQQCPSCGDHPPDQPCEQHRQRHHNQPPA